MTTDDHIF